MIIITFKIIVLHSLHKVWYGRSRDVHVYVHCKASLFIIIIVNTVD